MKLFLKFYVGTFNIIHLFSPSYYDDKKYRLLDPYKNKLIKVYDLVTPELLQKLWRETRINGHKYKSLYWFDDCMGQSGMRSPALVPILNNCRHNNTSVVALTQEIIGVSTNFRRQTEGFIGLQVQDNADRQQVLNSFGVGKKKNFEDLYDYCTREPYSFILMNYKV